jgi:copper homeostasis protein
MLLEIAAFNFQSAWLAANAGARRIELCENAHEGGTTPSYGTLKLAKEKIPIPIFPIIRPRGGDFLYNDEEFSIMQKDILLCKQLGYEGIVIGLLNADGTIDTKRTSQLTELAYPLDVTFHRAFDRTVDAMQALEDAIDCGCTRILTSGQHPNAFEGKDLIKQLVQQAADRIIIMPGSGIRSNNIRAIADYTGANELHSSARKNIPSNMIFNQPSMNENLQQVTVDETEIKSMIKLIKQPIA